VVCFVLAVMSWVSQETFSSSIRPFTVLPLKGVANYLEKEETRPQAVEYFKRE
jgi:hypothetical protein